MIYSNSIAELYFLNIDVNDHSHRRFIFVEAEDDLLVYKRILQLILKNNSFEQERTHLIAGEQQCCISDAIDYFDEEKDFSTNFLKKEKMSREEYQIYGYLKNKQIDGRFWKSNILKHGRGPCIDAYCFCSNYQQFKDYSFYCLVDRDIEPVLNDQNIIATDCRDLGSTILNYYLSDITDKWKSESLDELCSLIESSLIESYKVSLIQKALISKNITENENRSKIYFRDKFNYSLKNVNNRETKLIDTENAKNKICENFPDLSDLSFSKETNEMIFNHLLELKMINDEKWDDSVIKLNIANYDSSDEFSVFRVLTDHIVDNILYANDVSLLDESFSNSSLVDKVVSYCLRRIEKTEETRSILFEKLKYLILNDIN